MPKSKGAEKVMAAMKAEYGDKKGESIYYATANKQGRDERTFKKTSKSKSKKKSTPKSDKRGSYNDGGGSRVAKDMRHHMHKNKLWRS